jgi:Asp-tRNA(Asn)/Glu-tRNA(Gln) amidotransferase A subunit family amidase
MNETVNPIEAQNQAMYDLKSLKLPVLQGIGLRAFARLLDFPLTRSLLLPNLLKQGGVDRLRELHLTDDPVLYPLGPSDGAAPRLLPVSELEGLLGEPEPGPLFHKIRDYARLYRQGVTTPLEVAESALAAIQESDQLAPPMRIFVAVNREDILEQARAATQRIQSGQPLSLLDGVPVVIKDELNQAPYATFVGTNFLGRGPVGDCPPVARLRSAGALLLGKANMNEIGLDPAGFNAHHGTTRNPYQPAHDPGGSSSGPAAAVASGIAPVSLGCDGGGSIRIPAAFCGIVGLKPTFGRVSEAGTVPLCPSVDVIGPLGGSVEDVALVLGIIAGADPADPRSLVQPQLDLAGWKNADLSGLTLGVYPSWFNHAAEEVVSNCQTMLANLQAAGAKIVEIAIPGLDAMRIAHAVTIISEQAAHMRGYPDKVSQLSAPTRVSLALAHGFTSTDYIQAQRVRAAAIRTFEQVFEQVDAVLTPSTAITAPEMPAGSMKDGWSDLGVTTEKMRYAFPANLTGHPAVSFPAGYSRSGLPVGMQAIGRYWDEKTLFRIAYAAENALKRQPPEVFYDLLG